MTFISEAAIDEGGPRREFFTLGLSKMTEDPGIFCGPVSARLFAHNLQGIRKQMFYMAGVFVALSLANGGPALKCLSESDKVYTVTFATVYKRERLSAKLMRFMMTKSGHIC